jgi:hypothetical protein
MNKFLVVLGALVAGALLIPDVAEAQRGGRGGGGARVGGGGFGGGGGSRGGGSFRGGGFGGGSRMYIPRGGVGGARVGMANRGFRGGVVAARPGRGDGMGSGGFRQAAIANPGGRFDNRVGNRGDWRYGYGATGGRYPYYGGRYPYYGGRYPYYGVGAGLVTGSIIGAAATYPYYNYPYSTYQTPVASANGGYCATSVRTCALTSAAPVGTGCSCRTSGGRARGSVVAGY